MKLRDKILYMSFGAGLVVLGMVLNSLVSGDAEAQVGVKDATFKNVYCRGLTIADGNKMRGYFGLDDNGNAQLTIFGDDGKSVAFLGGNTADPDNKMGFFLTSKTNKSMVIMGIDKNGGRFDSFNKMGENVAFMGVATTGDGFVETRDKFGYKR